MSKTPSSSGLDLPIKRKRGRPRKDENMPRIEKRQTQTSISPSQPPLISSIQQPPMVTMNHTGDNHNMVGQVVTGVIDGIFDAGYLISVRTGPNNTPLRGLIFQQGHFCPITPTNDVAPRIKMYRREQFQISNSSNSQLCTPQAGCVKPPQVMPLTMQNYQATPMMGGASSNSGPPPDNLRMVEQDELMQVFEVSKMVQEQPKNDNFGNCLKDDQLVSDSDLMAESLPRDDVVKPLSLDCCPPLIQDINHESVTTDEVDKQKQHGENSEPITHVQAAMEETQSLKKDVLKQESEKYEGDVSRIDVNQDPNQEVAADLFQTN
ncbi:hypothetical protein CTI12_AA099820 [Artemisia annua]|uniref:AT hook, DNA-binding motif-containing protein n=1 Tax=Artemisia annua TaxID=35608 RepID=A0A2U1PV61_ARTAN|nr:hypothetical protein CTI12_AA099820 [Artemisia annua]